MMNQRSSCARFFLAAGLVLAVAGCGEARRQIGLDKSPPDEFAVVNRAPLSLPPDYSLRPPQPGTARPQEGSTSEQARQAILGGRTQLKATQPLVKGARTQGEMTVLKQAGADEIAPNIRRIVNEESTKLAEADRPLTDKIMFWGKPAEYSEALDPTKENKRLRENQALGKEIGEGDTPTIARKHKAIFEGIWD
ncbi:MAG: DUF3035 domain-containing protein [Alphaproteobacteria bacterium]|nr:DUF3035 domain-containing protein [Alphaproteobacteria bacterium]